MSLDCLTMVYEQHSLRGTSGAATATELCTRCKYRRLFGAAAVFHPSFSFLENSAHEIRDLHLFTLWIRRTVLASEIGTPLSLSPSPPSLSLFLLPSCCIPFPRLSFFCLATPIDALLRRLQNRSTNRILISDQRGFTRPLNAPRETIAHEFTISPRTKELVRIVPRSIDSLLHRA